MLVLFSKFSSLFAKKNTEAARFLRRVMILVLLWVGCFISVAAEKFTLVIDPGHGGKDTGATGLLTNEKTINLNVALAFGKLVEQNCPDVHVIYTRKTDIFVPLQTRADIANKAKANLFISIHTNAVASNKLSVRGAETYTLGMHKAKENLEVAQRENGVITLENNYQNTYKGFDPRKSESYIIFEFMQDRNMQQSVSLARSIQEQYTSKGRKNKGVHQAGFLVLRATSMPSVLTELGFISHPDEERFMASPEGVAAFSQALYEGFLKYRKNHTIRQSGNRIPTPQGQNKKVKKNDLPQLLPHHDDSIKSREQQNTAHTSLLNTEKAEQYNENVGELTPVFTQAFDSSHHKSPTIPDPTLHPEDFVLTAVQLPESELQTDTTNAQTQVLKRLEQTLKRENTEANAAKTALSQQTKEKKSINPSKNITQKAAQSKIASKKEKLQENNSTQATNHEANKVVYKIQLFVGIQQLSPKDKAFKGLTNVDYYQEDKYYKYTVGHSHSLSSIKKDLEQVRVLFPEAFIISFINGKRVSATTAEKMQQK